MKVSISIIVAVVIGVVILGLISNFGDTSGDPSAAELIKDGGKLIFQKEGSTYKIGDVDGAIAKYEEALLMEPDNVRAYNALGVACRHKYGQTGNKKWKEKELEVFQKAVDINPEDSASQFNLAMSLYNRNEKKKAAAHFKQAIELNPRHHEKEKVMRMIAEGENG